MTVLVCEPMIHAVAYCDNKSFFKQVSESLIQGLLPGGEYDEVENEEESCSDDGESDEIEVSSESCDEEAEFDSENFDDINDDVAEVSDSCNDEDCEGCDKDNHFVCEDEKCVGESENEDFEEECDDNLVFDYSALSKFIFNFGGREDILVRNRRFLYELGQIIEQVSTNSFESCCNQEACGEGSCCN